MRLHATIQNEKMKTAKLGSNERLEISLSIGNKCVAVVGIEEMENGRVEAFYQTEDTGWIDALLGEWKGKKQKGKYCQQCDPVGRMGGELCDDCKRRNAEADAETYKTEQP